MPLPQITLSSRNARAVRFLGCVWTDQHFPMNKKLEKPSQLLITYSLQACSLLQYRQSDSGWQSLCLPAVKAPGSAADSLGTGSVHIPPARRHTWYPATKHTLPEPGTACSLLRTWQVLHQAREASSAAWQHQTTSGTSLSVSSRCPTNRTAAQPGVLEELCRCDTTRDLRGLLSQLHHVLRTTLCLLLL